MDPLAYLFGLEKLGIKFGLENIRALCESLDNPQLAYPSILIAGTNGKGSTTAMVECALRRSGKRTGRYTSPHLIHLAERFVIDGEPATEAEIRDLAQRVRSSVDALMASRHVATQPTFFEVTTAMALELFRRRRVDVAVLEVGLGGRFDATNVVTPVLTAITSIAFDHEQFLGHTLDAIAREKAGIIKPGVPVVVGRLPPEAEAAIAEVAGRVHAELVRAHDDVRLAAEIIDGRTVMDLRTGRHDYGRFTLALRGRHQIDNALVAVALLETLGDQGFAIQARDIRAGLEQASWPGRLDLVTWPDGRRALFDAAHNPAGAASAAEYLREIFDGGLPMVFAAMADKDWRGMLRLLLPCATHLIVTRAANPRAADPIAIAAAARDLGGTHVEVVEPAVAALQSAWRYAPTVAVTGSIFLVGELMDSSRGG